MCNVSLKYCINFKNAIKAYSYIQVTLLSNKLENSFRIMRHDLWQQCNIIEVQSVRKQKEVTHFTERALHLTTRGRYDKTTELKINTFTSCFIC